MKHLIKSGIAATVLLLALPAMAEVVVVVNPKAAESSMTKDQVAQFFLPFRLAGRLGNLAGFLGDLVHHGGGIVPVEADA